MNVRGYEFVRHLGIGGTAQVDCLRSKINGQLVALKYPLNSTDNDKIDFPRLAARESTLVGRDKFPGLVKILKHSENPSFLFLECCQGPSLDQICPINNETEVLNLLSALSVSLEYLRLKGLVHGDLKPQNVFLPSSWKDLAEGNYGFVKISDFSLGRFVDEPESARAGMGTVGYMAPETITGNRCNHQSDLFALGVIGYIMLSGQHPFLLRENPDPIRTNGRIIEGRYKSLSKLRPELKDSTVKVINRLLSVSPQDRFRSAWDVCLALKRCGASIRIDQRLRPKYLIPSNSNYSEIVNKILEIDESEKSRLNQLTGESIVLLRFLLEDNFNCGLLRFNGKFYSLEDNWYWPVRMRTRALNIFSKSKFGIRRNLVKQAISDRVCHLSLQNTKNQQTVPPALGSLLLQLIKPSAIKRYSVNVAKTAEKNEDYEKASRLYIQAGDIESAERCAETASVHFVNSNDPQKALKVLSNCITYAKECQKSFQCRQLLIKKGDLLKSIGESESAQTVYNNLISLYQDQPVDRLLAETYKDLGDLYKLKQDSTGALEALEKALKIYEELEDELEISHTLNNLGNACWIAGDLPAALIKYRAALHIQRKLKADTDTASSLSNIGSVYGIIGRYRRSLKILDLSLQMKRELGDQGEIARTLNNMGYVYHISGQQAQAVAAIEESLEFNRKIGSQIEVLFNLENLSTLAITAGQLKKSFSFIEEGLELAENLQDKPHAAALHANFGIVNKRVGKFDQAEKGYRKARKLFEEIDDKPLGSAIDAGEASLRQAIGDVEDAMRLALQATSSAREIGEKPSLLNCLILLISLKQDKTNSQEALSLASELKMKREQYLVEINDINHNIKTGLKKELENATETLKFYLSTFIEDVEYCSIANLLIRTLLQLQKYGEALTPADNAIKACRKRGQQPELAQALSLRGAILFQTRDYEEAFSNLKEALSIHKQIAGTISKESDRILYQNQDSIRFLIEQIGGLKNVMAKK